MNRNSPFFSHQSSVPRNNRRGTVPGGAGGADVDGISVVVPTYGSPASVARLLSSLRRAADQLPPAIAAEFIVVDDSPPADARAIAELCRRHGAEFLRGPRRVGAKRNIGARRARFDIIFFIDSDCVADPQVLNLHLAAHAAYRDALSPSGRRVGAVAGPTVVPDAHTDPVWRVIAPSVVVNSAWLWPKRFAEVWWAATANLSVRREAFWHIGGFDEDTYTVVGGEDVDFGVRLNEAGYATVCHPGALVRHATDGINRLAQFRAKMFKYGRAGVYNCVRQPEHARWSANPITLAAAGVVTGLIGRLAAGRGWAPVPVGRVGGWLSGVAVGLAAAAFVTRSVQTARRYQRSLADGAGMVSVDWAFHAGITAEALRRGRPLLALRRYHYFPPERFYPAPRQAGGSAMPSVSTSTAAETMECGWETAEEAR